MKKLTGPLPICMIAVCAVLNLVGGTIALIFRLPIYLDSFGTMFAAAVLGPAAGILPGLISGLISGCTSDVYAFYYIPVQMVIGLVSGFVFLKFSPAGRGHRKRFLPAAAIICFPGTLVSSAITAFLFGGITSSGSTVIVQALHAAGLPLTACVFLVQFITDYL